jgi:predicted sugar kinase
LQDSLQRGNVGEVLIQLTEDLGRQRERFCKLLQQIGADGLNLAVEALSTTQMMALSEAVAAEKLETAIEILQSAKANSGPNSDKQEDQVNEVVGQLLSLLAKLEFTAPDFQSALTK